MRVGEPKTVRIAVGRFELRIGRRAAFEAGRRAERERRRATALLAQRVGEQRAVAELGRRALETTEPVMLIGDAARLVQRALVVDHCEILELQDDRRTLRVRAGAGRPEEEIEGGDVIAEPESYARHALRSSRAVIVTDLESDDRFERPAALIDHGVCSSASVVIRGLDGPYGLLRVHAGAPGRFDDDTADFLESVANVVGSAIDRARAEDATRHHAFHDALTGLPNRTLFLDRLEHALVTARRSGARVGVLLIDVDQFKMFNDSLGHQAGDELLTLLAPRLASAVRESDTVARLGGDEFVVLVEDAVGEPDVTRLAERLAGVLAEPFHLDGRELFVSCSTGIALSSGDADTPDALLHHADTAMYRAKERGRGGHALFDEPMRGRALERLHLETDLRRALARDEFRLLYQPIVSLRSGRTVGIEALLRWDHPDRGTIGPDVFIPIAEETGLILPIGRWVLEHACAQVARWQAELPDAAGLTLSVNVSGRQLSHGSLVDDVERVLETYGLTPGTLGLEITESVLMGEGPEQIATLTALRSLGARILLDDFGTGYSSLSYLKRFPLDALKIDRSFVAGLGRHHEDSAIVTSIMSMAHTLGLTVVAEGVETEQQLGRLRELGCGRAQGFLMARPLAPDVLAGDGALWGASLLPVRMRA
ncbi:MAG: hypothetical protein QOJ07_3751 [Thermoleophilaceae bacterium]|nr:hypothetical protein [Thermoleophilaceae bacterium]